MQPQHAKRWIAKSLHNLRENTMSQGECITNEITGPKDGPGDDASRYGDGTFRLCLEEIDAEMQKAMNDARMYEAYGQRADKRECLFYARGLRKSKSILLKHTKEKACSAGGTTPTSTPSP